MQVATSVESLELENQLKTGSLSKVDVFNFLFITLLEDLDNNLMAFIL